MSTHWSLRCVPCDEVSADFGNHVDQALAAVVRKWPRIRDFLAEVEEVATIEFDGISYGQYALRAFLRDHHDHGVVLRDEYGGEASPDSANPHEDAEADWDRKREAAG